MHVHTKDAGHAPRVEGRWLGSHTRSRLAMIGGVAGVASAAALMGVASPASAACSASSACKAGMDWDPPYAVNLHWVTLDMSWQYWNIPNWTTERSNIGLWAHWNSTSSWVAVGAWRGYLSGVGATNTSTWYKGAKDPSTGAVTYANVSGSGTLGTGPASGDQFALAFDGQSGTGCWTGSIGNYNPSTGVSTGAALVPLCGYGATTNHVFAGMETKVTPSTSFKLKGYGSQTQSLGNAGMHWDSGTPGGAAPYVTPGSGYCASGPASSFDFSADTIPC